MTDPQVAFTIFCLLIARGLFYVLWEIDAEERQRRRKFNQLRRMLGI